MIPMKISDQRCLEQALRLTNDSMYRNRKMILIVTLDTCVYNTCIPAGRVPKWEAW